MTMEQQVMDLLRKGWTTPLQALQEAGCLSLAQRVSEWIRAGLPVEKKWVELPNGKKVRAYRLGSPA